MEGGRASRMERRGRKGVGVKKRERKSMVEKKKSD